MNGLHQLADCLTKYSDKRKPNLSLLLDVLAKGELQIAYCEGSGRRQTQEQTRQRVLAEFEAGMYGDEYVLDEGDLRPQLGLQDGTGAVLCRFSRCSEVVGYRLR